MSRMTPYELRCPHCGNTQETGVWDSINVTLDPELKDKLFQAEINIFSCAQCGEKTFINVPLLYHDMERTFCVQYYPPEALEDDGFFAQFNIEGGIEMEGIPPQFVKFGEYITKPHVVFDMTEMIRYVSFRDRLHELKSK